MANKDRAYELSKQYVALQHLHNKYQQSIRMKSQLERRELMKEFFKLFDEISGVKPDVCDNALEQQGTEEPFLEIERKNGPHLQNLKEKIGELFIEEEKQSNEVKLPDNLETSVADIKMEVQEQKEQLKANTRLVNNFDVILENNLNSVVAEGTDSTKMNTDSTEKESM